MIENFQKPQCIENGAREISNCWIVKDDGEEIAIINMSVTALHGFEGKHVRKLLKDFSLASHAFYLEVGNALKGEQHDS